jgi:hypothetical protein
MNKVINPSILFIFLLISFALLNGCITTKQPSQSDGLPVLSQDELIRPYTKLGRIKVTREVFGTDYSVSADIVTWGLLALRQEAEKLGADAVMLPEVTGHTTTTGVFPSTEFSATGFAIKFK